MEIIKERLRSNRKAKKDKIRKKSLEELSFSKMEMANERINELKDSCKEQRGKIGENNEQSLRKMWSNFTSSTCR